MDMMGKQTDEMGLLGSSMLVHVSFLFGFHFEPAYDDWYISTFRIFLDQQL